MFNLLNVGGNAKTIKGDKKQEYLTGILYLAPASISGRNVCPNSTAGCRAACLYTAGRGQMSSTQEARIRKTKLFFENRDSFMAQLFSDLHELRDRCERRGVKPAVRLNGTSDIDWQRIKYQGKTVFDSFPDIVFYDYTKCKRVSKHTNYHITHSYDERWTPEDAQALVNQGQNVAVVFDDTPPAHWYGMPVHDGDSDDLRFLDPKGCIVGLKAKGQARYDTSGFVQHVRKEVPYGLNPTPV